jgi:hypothetical protein
MISCPEGAAQSQPVNLKDEAVRIPRVSGDEVAGRRDDGVVKAVKLTKDSRRIDRKLNMFLSD